MDLNKFIRNIPDFPKPGIQFKDITPLLNNAEAFKHSIELFKQTLEGKNIDKIAGVESRGFIFGAPISLKLGIGFIPIRKPGKLPADTISVDYELEYGKNTLEIHKDALKKGERVVIIDDLLATGGTAAASATLVEKVGGVVESLEFVVELDFLNGRELIKNYNVHSLLKY